MNTARFKTRRITVLAIAVAAFIAVPASAAGADEGPSLVTTQTNLVANRVGFGAAVVDPNLVNAWGMSKFPTSPVWVSDNGTDLSTLYSGGSAASPSSVTVRGLVVSVPGGPTGQIANATTGFKLSNGSPALFVFANEAGELHGWNQAAGTAAELTATVADGNLKGLAQATVGSASYLFAADFSQGRIDVFDSAWNQVNWAGAFHVRHLPKGFAPFNVQVLRDSSGTDHVYVAYALRDPATNDAVAGKRLGLIAEFTTSGAFVRRFERSGLNAPWGLAFAPASWGRDAGDLLVGQFGDGNIEVFNPRNGEHEGSLRDAMGHKVVIDGLWALMPGDATSGGAGSVLFTAGPNEEADGLYGVLSATLRMHGHDD